MVLSLLGEVSAGWIWNRELFGNFAFLVVNEEWDMFKFIVHTSYHIFSKRKFVNNNNFVMPLVGWCSKLLVWYWNMVYNAFNYYICISCPCVSTHLNGSTKNPALAPIPPIRPMDDIYIWIVSSKLISLKVHKTHIDDRRPWLIRSWRFTCKVEHFILWNSQQIYLAHEHGQTVE